MNDDIIESVDVTTLDTGEEKKDKKSDAKKGGIIIGACCIGLIIIAVFFGMSSSEKKLVERPLIIDDDGHKIVSVNVSENYGVAGVHALQWEFDDDYQLIKALNLSNNTDLKVFKDVVDLTKSSSQLDYNGVNYYKIGTTQKLKNRPLNVYGGLKVKDINTYIGYNYNNETKMAVVVLGTNGVGVAENLGRVNFYN